MIWTRNARTFESQVLPYLNAAYTLARWLTGNVQDAEDAVQDAYLRALRFWGDCRGENCRAWLLQIVRNSCYTRMHANLPQSATTPFEDEIHIEEPASPTPEALAIKNADVQVVRDAIRGLPLQYREVLILRELEDMSYLEIARITRMPLGTVRSNLFRARRLLRDRVSHVINGNKVQSSSRVPAAFPAPA